MKLKLSIARTKTIPRRRNQKKRAIQTHNKQSDAIIADIREVVRSWFACNDNLSHRECDILNSVVKCYKQ